MVIPGLPMHVVQRGNNRQATFFAKDDYRVYLEANEDQGVRVLETERSKRSKGQST